MYRIAIIGAGWYGCHLANILKDKYQVSLFEAKNDIMQGASCNIHNRFHLGYHYPRSFRTRSQILDGVNRFLHYYVDFIDYFDHNIYGIAETSCIDYGTYLKINEGLDFAEVNPKDYGLEHLEGAIVCKEGKIDINGIRGYFKDILKDCLITSCPVFEIVQTSNKVFVNEREYDYCIVSTFNRSFPMDIHVLYELAILLIYHNINRPKFGSITIMDGPFSSLFPVDKNKYRLANVCHTPFYINSDLSMIDKFVNELNIGNKLLQDLMNRFEDNINYFYPTFLHDFIFEKFVTAVKVKPINNSSANRELFYEINNKVLKLYSGKINNIIAAQDVVEDWICN